MHSHIHKDKQYVCYHEGCGRKFLDSSKLKRHFLIHTGERSFVCPPEGCGKQLMRDDMKRTSQSERIHNTTNAHVVYATPTPERPYACPYGRCGKTYIHEYKLNLHLRREHAGLNAEETGKPTPIINAYNMDGASDYDGYPLHRDSGSRKKLKRYKPKLPSKFTPPTKVAKGKGLLSISSAYTNMIQLKYKQATTMNEDDSEKTEEEREKLQNGDGEEDDGDTEYLNDKLREY